MQHPAKNALATPAMSPLWHAPEKPTSVRKVRSLATSWPIAEGCQLPQLPS